MAARNRQISRRGKDPLIRRGLPPRVQSARSSPMWIDVAVCCAMTRERPAVAS